MMEDFLSGPGMIVAIIAICTAGWLINNWIRAKHGYDLEDEWGGKTSRADKSAETEALRAENASLVQRLDDHADRLKVLERIVTERRYSLSDEIQALRRDESSGMPIDTGKKETV
ncbi:hypothetical protein [Alteriqipengyuania sp. 357]